VRAEAVGGGAVGTFDPRLPTAVSVITAFHLPPTAAWAEPRSVRPQIVHVPVHDTDLDAAATALVRGARVRPG
jgi:hypothetical protein